MLLINNLESVANYVGGPVASVALDSQLDRIRNVTKNNIDNEIDKINSGIGIKKKDYNNSILNKLFNDNSNYIKLF